MRLTLWGTRGSVGRAGPDTLRYGGDTSAVQVESDDGRQVILDAGSGIVRLGAQLPDTTGRIDLFLTHLHMDHIQGLGFFRPLFDPNVEVHLWGPISTTMQLKDRLARYLSPPLFPVRLRDLHGVELHDLGPGTVELGSMTVTADLVCHPGPTLGYRLSENGKSLTYLPDHEVALGNDGFACDPNWLSGFDLANGADVLIHDAQYTDDEYEIRQGWGHSTFAHTAAYAACAGVGTLVTFHHDPEHSDDALDAELDRLLATDWPFELVPGTQGLTIDV